jgi:hypothetical protein
VEAQLEEVDEEVDDVALEVALGPAPVGFFDDEYREGGQLEVARLLLEELEAAFLEQRDQGRHAGGADLFSGPSRRAVGHSLFSNGVE